MPAENLTRAEARLRASVVRPESYRVELDLTRGAEVFGTTTTLRFGAVPGSATFVDLIAPAVHRIVLNGRELDTAAFAESRIHLTDLAEHNELTVVADGAYMSTGEGMHRFVDPVDEEVYLYTQFEVPDARRVFACFEQPDLKAEFTFVVTAPERWTVFSGEPADDVADAGAGARRWTFAPTARISTYLTSVVAGPYAGGTGELTSTDGRTIPLGVYARASIAEHLDVAEILDVTRRGMTFYEETFDRPYPFTKYDQVFVPEFNAGAMENVGLVTYLETYVFRGPVPGSLRERRIITVLHELAHMWFGNLVTMRWWNDLWLNESFAEYASHLAAAEGLGIEDAWVTFNALEKAWAYDQDQLPTTHPIVAPIEDLADVEVNFDGITYAKGSSVLTQLVAFVGKDAFLTGLRRYFAKHAFGTTELTDLLVELQEASGRDLREWSRLWLETAGVTTLTPEITAQAGDDGVERITGLAVRQTVPEAHPVQRPHRLRVAGYDLAGEHLVRTWVEEVDVDGELTRLPTIAGRPRPAILLVNDDDLAYAKVRLDERSLASATRYVDRFTDAMPRSLVLASAWDMTRDGEWPATRYLDLAMRALASETQPTAMRVLLANVRTAVERYCDPAVRDEVRTAAADSLLDLTDAAEPGSDAQLQLSRAAALGVVTDGQVARVRGWIDGSAPLPGQEVDAQHRWEVLRGLALAGAVTEEEIEAELAADPSATGREHAVWVRASRPEPEAKEEVWRRVVEAADLPNAQQRNAALGFADVRDVTLLAPYVRRYLDALPRVWAEQTSEMAQNVVNLMFPAALAGRADEAGVDLVAEVRGWLAVGEDAPAALRRLVTERLDTAERAVRAQAVDAG